MRFQLFFDNCLVLISIFFCIQKCDGSHVKYKGCKVYQIEAKDESQIQKIKRFIKSFPTQIDVWSDSPQHCQLMVTKEQSIKLDAYLSKENIQRKILIKDVQKAIDKELEENDERVKQNVYSAFRRRRIFNYKRFNRFGDILHELKRLQCRFKKKMEIMEIGRSYERRPLVVVKITKNVLNECISNKKIVWIDGGVHSREWISVAGAMWMIKELLISKKTSIQKLLETHVFYIAPVFNPDGYEYTFTDDRLWRKTRRPTNKKGCIGTDVNRNWNFKWGLDEKNKEPCGLTYHGEKPESEICVQHFARLFRYIQPRLQSYWTLHSYGQLVYVPYSYTSKFSPYVSDLIQALFVFREKAKSRNNQFYGLGTTHVLENGLLLFGTSIDYMHGTLNITYSFNVEMRPSEATLGQNQNPTELFLLSPKSIVPASSEVFDGIIGTVEHIYGRTENQL
ncbi:zinc carboxypeptidase-like [Clytia hemisphaerica]|uniref:Peptidase M14 domain-containing protein n=1 Tax=Clytia hemisphaerica TaxID=252671 RepID=A0A7M5XAV5_9CNID